MMFMWHGEQFNKQCLVVHLDSPNLICSPFTPLTSPGVVPLVCSTELQNHSPDQQVANFGPRTAESAQPALFCIFCINIECKVSSTERTS